MPQHHFLALFVHTLRALLEYTIPPPSSNSSTNLATFALGHSFLSADVIFLKHTSLLANSILLDSSSSAGERNGQVNDVSRVERKGHDLAEHS
jgi:hypothetical protein